MKRSLTILLFSLFLGTFLGPSLAGDCVHAPRIEGKKARKARRYQLYQKVLKGDKKRIFKKFGYTPNRLRIDHGFGRITETWTYHDRGLEFTFDQDSNLVEKRSIPVEDRSVTYY